MTGWINDLNSSAPFSLRSCSTAQATLPHEENRENVDPDSTSRMNAPLVPDVGLGSTRVLEPRRLSPYSRGSSWEYKIGIAPANEPAAQQDFREQFLKAMGDKGWVLVGESQGILHFKRLKKGHHRPRL